MSGSASPAVHAAQAAAAVTARWMAAGAMAAQGYAVALGLGPTAAAGAVLGSSAVATLPAAETTAEIILEEGRPATEWAVWHQAAAAVAEGPAVPQSVPRAPPPQAPVVSAAPARA